MHAKTPSFAAADADRRSVDVSVLVPVLNEERHLDSSIARMVAQEFYGAVEFLLIDGGSQDRSREVIAAWSARDDRVVLLRNPGGGTPQALNIGLRHASGTYVARMDAHTNYPPHYLARGVARLARGDVVSVSGPQLAVGGGRWSRRVALALGTPLGVGGARFRRQELAEHEVLSGFTGIWRRDLLLQQGGWDEGWLNDQDTELAARLRAAGGRIVCVPDMAAEYIPRDDLAALARQYWRYGVFRVKTSRRHPSTLRKSQLLPPSLVLATGAAAAPFRSLRSPGRAALGAYATAVTATALGQVRQGSPRDVAALLAIFPVMHVAYGAGFLAGCVRDGIPVAALLHAVGGPLARPHR